MGSRITRVMGFLPANVQLSRQFRSGWNVKTAYESCIERRCWCRPLANTTAKYRSERFKNDTDSQR